MCMALLSGMQFIILLLSANRYWEHFAVVVGANVEQVHAVSERIVERDVLFYTAVAHSCLAAVYYLT